METFRSVLFVVALINVAAVLFTLFGGLFAMTRGEHSGATSNKLMRLRVGLQLSAVLLLGLYFLLSRAPGG